MFQTSQEIDGAEERLARSRPGARAWDVFQQPTQFQAGKVGCEREAGLAAKPVLATVLAKLGHEPVRARVLPDNRVAERLAGGAIPKERRLALIGDADADEIGGGKPGRSKRIRHGGDRIAPDLRRVVLHPAGFRINLLVLLLRGADDRAFPVENEKACGGCPLIDRANKPAHVILQKSRSASSGSPDPVRLSAATSR